MAELKTKPTDVPVADFLAGLENPRRREDGAVLAALMGEITGEPATMWGPTLIGFGKLRYVYESGHSGEMFRVGFSPRKPHLVIYNYSNYPGGAETVARLGKTRSGVGCLYVNKLADIDMGLLRELLERGYANSFKLYPPH
jgi:hypothetical protein